MDLISLRKSLEEQKYIFDEEFLIIIHIAMKLNKPILIEGPAGVGKTEVAKVLSSILGAELIRLQCYEGLDESKALYEWNYQKQLMSIQKTAIDKNDERLMNSNNADAKASDITGLFSRDYLLERPLLKAISSDKKSVLLIDEIDKTDEEFEAFLLEILSDFQVSIPEMGTLTAKIKPIVILTSNNTRQLSDALKRRCIYMYLDYPSVDKEVRIIQGRVAGVNEKLARNVAQTIAALRKNDRLIKKPSIAETLDWVAALMVLDRKELDTDSIEKTIGFVLKNREDILEIQKGDWSNELLANKYS